MRPIAVDNIDIGDVLTYQITSGEPAVISHRVISKTVGTDGTTTFITKGDNNDVADVNPVLEAQVKGTVWYSFPWLGYINNAVNGEARSWIVPVLAVVLFVYGGYTLASSAVSRARRRKNRRGDASVDNKQPTVE